MDRRYYKLDTLSGGRLDYGRLFPIDEKRRPKKYAMHIKRKIVRIMVIGKCRNISKMTNKASDNKQVNDIVRIEQK